MTTSYTTSLAPSTSLAEATSRVWDAIVVGGGVAGASVAHKLALLGHHILVVERAAFPRYKVCGCCLNLRSLQHLAEAGLESQMRALGGVPLNALSLHAGRSTARLDLPGGLALSRAQLDLAMLQAATKAGAHVLTEVAAEPGDDSTPESRQVRLRAGDRTEVASARLVIAADGLNGTFMKKAVKTTPTIHPRAYIGVGAMAQDTTFERGTIHMHCGPSGYVGAVAVEGGVVAVAAAVSPTALRNASNTAEAVSRLVEASGHQLPIDLSALSWGGTPPLTRSATALAAHRLVAVGDATGYIEPFTGEGMAWALEGAAALADHLHRCAPVAWDQAAQAWPAIWKAQIPRRQFWCRGVSMALRSPRLTSSAVRILSRVPALSRPVVRALNQTPGSTHV